MSLPTLIDIQNVLQTWVSSETGMTTIWAKQNAPRPAMPYCLLTILSLTRAGHDEELPPGDDGVYKIVSNNYLNVNISIFYKKDDATFDSFNVLDSLRLSVKKQSVNDYFNANNLSFIRPLTSIMDISNVVATGFEQRAVLDMQFLVATYINDLEYLIKSVSGTGDIEVNRNINYEV